MRSHYVVDLYITNGGGKCDCIASVSAFGKIDDEDFLKLVEVSSAPVSAQPSRKDCNCSSTYTKGGVENIAKRTVRIRSWKDFGMKKYRRQRLQQYKPSEGTKYRNPQNPSP